MQLERPTVEQLGDLYQVTWPVTGVQIAFDRLTESRDGLFAETTFARFVPGQAPGLLLDVRMNLLSGTTKGQVVKTLAAQIGDVDWLNVLEAGCFLVKRRFRDGDPAVDLASVQGGEQPRWIIRPYLASDRPALLFAAGGTGKTMFALALAVACASGRAFVGHAVGPPRKVLVLDYESDRYVHRERVNAICAGAGFGALPPDLIYHRKMDVPLAIAAPALRREIAERGIGLAVVDSLAQASGELEESGPIVQCFGAIRSFGVPTIILSHITKGAMQADEEGSGRKRLAPFGSVFSLNSAGNAWSLRRRGGEDESGGSLLLVHEKTNNGRYFARHAYRVSYLQEAGEDGALLSCSYHQEEYGESFSDHLPLTEVILRLLTKDGPKTPADLLTALPDVAGATLRSTLSNLKSGGRVVQLDDRRYAAHASTREA